MTSFLRIKTDSSAVLWVNMDLVGTVVDPSDDKGIVFWLDDRHWTVTDEGEKDKLRQWLWRGEASVEPEPEPVPVVATEPGAHVVVTEGAP